MLVCMHGMIIKMHDIFILLSEAWFSHQVLRIGCGCGNEVVVVPSKSVIAAVPYVQCAWLVRV